MRENCFLLLMNLCLVAFAGNIQAASINDDFQNSTYIGPYLHKDSATQTMKQKYVDLEIGLPQEQEFPTPITNTGSHWGTWGENISGNFLSLTGVPIAAMGGVLVTAPEVSVYMGRVGISLTALGFIMSRGGQILLERSRKEAATIAYEMEKHAKKITINDLSAEEIERLSAKFFEIHEKYQAYVGCVSEIGGKAGMISWFSGPAMAAAGMGLIFRGDNATLGCILTVVGAAAFTVGDAIKEKVDAYNAQQQLCKAVKFAQTKNSDKHESRQRQKRKSNKLRSSFDSARLVS